MKEKLIEYGFVEEQTGWLKLQKKEWDFHFNPDDSYMWLYPPHCGEGEGMCLTKLTYEKTINVIEFISQYE